jgi:hypothetical protein
MVGDGLRAATRAAMPLHWHFVGAMRMASLLSAAIPRRACLPQRLSNGTASQTASNTRRGKGPVPHFKSPGRDKLHLRMRMGPRVWR